MNVSSTSCCDGCTYCCPHASALNKRESSDIFHVCFMFLTLSQFIIF